MMDHSRIHGSYLVTPMTVEGTPPRFATVYTSGGVGNESFVAVIVTKNGGIYRQSWTCEQRTDPADAIQEAKDIAFAAGIACHLPEIVPAIERAADAASAWAKTAFQSWAALSPTARRLAITRFVDATMAELAGDGKS